MQYNLHASINEFYDLMLVVYFASYQIVFLLHITFIDRHMDGNMRPFQLTFQRLNVEFLRFI